MSYWIFCGNFIEIAKMQIEISAFREFMTAQKMESTKDEENETWTKGAFAIPSPINASYFYLNSDAKVQLSKMGLLNKFISHFGR